MKRELHLFRQITKGIIQCIICILLVQGNLFAQNTKKEGKTKEGFRKLYTEANEMTLEGFNDSALHIFLYLYSLDTNNANIAYYIGQLYLTTPAYKALALPYLEKAAKNISQKYIPDDPYEKNAPPPTYYYLARAQHLNYQFDNAIDNFNKFKKMIPKKDSRQEDIDYWIQCCNNGKILIQTPVDCKVINMGDSINSAYPDYCPVLTSDEQEILFTSKRPVPGGDNLKDINGEYYEDIWISYAKPGDGWTTARDLGPPVNSPGNDATCSISPDGQTLIMYRDEERTNGTYEGDIYVSYKSGSSWSTPSVIDSSNPGLVNSPYQETHACLSIDGKTLYFASDRPGGLGGLDIYRINISDSGKWSDPVNLGPTINTKYDEEAPYIHPNDSALLFSSKGHNTMGGYDVFIAKLNNKGIFDEAQNLGYPINTPDDDVYFTLSADGKRAYYCSVRPNGYGENDIYEVIFNTPMKISPPVAILVGYIKTPDGSPIPGDLTISTSESNSAYIVKTKVNTKTGKFLQVLKPNTSYKVVISSQGKVIDNYPFYLPVDSSYSNLSRPFFRTSITLGDTTNLLAAHKHITAITSVKTKDMSGQILDENNKPIPMLTIQLVNDKDSVIATTITDKNGHFTFKKLPADKTFGLLVNANDSKFKRLKNLYIASEEGRIVRDFDAKNKENFMYNNLPVDLSSLQTLALANVKNTQAEKYSKDTASMPKSDADFTRYFAYNINKLNSSDADFEALVNKIAAKASQGPVTIVIKGSASKVPTNIFQASNALLAQHRASDTRQRLMKALKDKQVKMSDVTIKSNFTVQGPDYAGDASNQVKYEKFQYVKVYVQ